VLGARTNDLAPERDEVDRKLAALPKRVEVVALHPSVMARYESQVAALQVAVAKSIDASDADALAAPELVETVMVGRGEKPDSIQIEISGRVGASIGEKVFRIASNVCGENW
jgi:site-specific DNA recombinase